MVDALAHTVQTASPVAWGIWLLVAIAGAGATFVLGFQSLRRARLVEDTPTARLRSAPQGLVELAGAGYLLPGDPIVSPLSGQTCLWFSYTIKERDDDGGWDTVESGTSDGLFALRDETGECIVDPDGASVIDAQSRTWTGAGADRALRTRTRLGGGRYRYSEQLLLPASPLYAIGYLRTHDGAQAWDTAAEMLELLRAWKKDQPALIARFDTDRNGRIDTKEWENARRAARAEIDAARREEATRPGLNVLSRPPDGRPFILAAAPQRRLARRYRTRAIAGIGGFFLCTGATLYLMAQRLT